MLLTNDHPFIKSIRILNCHAALTLTFAPFKGNKTHTKLPIYHVIGRLHKIVKFKILLHETNGGNNHPIKLG